MNENNNSNSLDNEIDLAELFSIIWNKKLFISILTSIAALISVLYALYLPNIYTSSSLLAPTTEDNSLSSQLGSFSGLAGLAGVSLPAGNISNSQIAVKRIESFEFFSKYFLPNIKLEDLMAVDEWDAKNNTVVYDDSEFNSTSNEWSRKPSDQKAYKEYKRALSISQEELTGLVYLSMKHKSPVVAQNWVDTIIYNINECMREIDKQDAQNSIDFLNESLKNTNSQSIKVVFAKLMESQMQTLMLASSNEAYVFKTINSPIVPEDKSSPSRALICILGTLLGGILSILIVLFRNFRQTS
ncbi:Wzz/FepE/Etk N-terminal domain-containing protein [Gammaproteobacteria bacterium]|nr:Wzz/FepE/Etk N-terminal domain-containing protein [Gammaproteobacteria bacterium]